MTEQEVKEAIKDIPVGGKVQIIKKNGAVIEVLLMSQEVEATEKKDYGAIVVPALPPAILVRGSRFGSYRIDAEDIVNIAWVK